MDILGNRFVGLLDLGVYYDRHTKRLFQSVNREKVYPPDAAMGFLK